MPAWRVANRTGPSTQCSEAPWAAADAALTPFGGQAVASKHDIQRMWRATHWFRSVPIFNRLVLAY